VATVVFVAPRLRARWPAKPLRSSGSARQDLAAAAVIGSVAIVAAVVVSRRTLACVAVDGRLPEAAPVALLERAPGGRLVTFFDWGEYALWHLGPSIRVSMDGRRETVYSDARLADHDAILAGTARGLALLDEWQPDYVWLPASSRGTREWLTARGYRIDFSSARSFVAVRPGVPPLVPAAASSQIPRCFPD
jgi:hypothetical protein